MIITKRKSNDRLGGVVLLALLLCGVGAAAQTFPTSGTAASNPQPASLAAEPGLLIGPGDLLEVLVVDTPELSARLRVDAAGDITLPVGGKVHVAGMPPDAAKTAIENRLRTSEVMRFPHVSVSVTEYSSQTVTVAGEVKNAGVFPLIGARTYIDMIAAAGGVTANASKTFSVIHRDHPNEHETFVLSTTAVDVETANLPVQPGDRIIVARAGIVYVVGDVVRPGGFIVETNSQLTVLQAVALAQGANRTAKLEETAIIHRSGSGGTSTPVRLKEVFRREAPDPMLQDGDILYIPESLSKTLLYRGVEAAIQLTVGLAVYGRF